MIIQLHLTIVFIANKFFVSENLGKVNPMKVYISETAV